MTEIEKAFEIVSIAAQLRGAYDEAQRNLKAKDEEITMLKAELETLMDRAKKAEEKLSHQYQLNGDLTRRSVEAEAKLAVAEARAKVLWDALDMVTPEFEKYMMQIPIRGDIQVLQACVKALAAQDSAKQGKHEQK